MINHFDFIASKYDRLIGTPDIQRLKSLLRLPVTGWMLDAGGGTGRVSAYLIQYVDHIVVCDVSMDMLKQSKNKAELVRTRAHVEMLPFRDDMFDRIIVVDALHHFCDQQRALSDLLRVLKRGGRMVIEEPDIDRPIIKIIALLEKLVLMNSHFCSASSLSAMVEQEGLSARVAYKDKLRMWLTIDK